jgi:hypothetical protein
MTASKIFLADVLFLVGLLGLVLLTVVLPKFSDIIKPPPDGRKTFSHEAYHFYVIPTRSIQSSDRGNDEFSVFLCRILEEFM